MAILVKRRREKRIDGFDRTVLRKLAAVKSAVIYLGSDEIVDDCGPNLVALQQLCTVGKCVLQLFHVTVQRSKRVGKCLNTRALSY